MPFRLYHNCTINKDATQIVETRTVESKWGELKIVMARNRQGKLVPRGIRIPVSVPVGTARELCRARGGQFEPATPADPRKELLSGSGVFSIVSLNEEGKRELLEEWIRSFEMPEMQLAKWTAASVNDLPDSCFIVILPGGKKDEGGKTVPRSLRLLPYKDKNGKIDEAHVKNALARVNQISAGASVKRSALAKLLRIAHALGIETQEKEKFKMSDLDYLLSLQEKFGG